VRNATQFDAHGSSCLQSDEAQALAKQHPNSFASEANTQSSIRECSKCKAYRSHLRRGRRKSRGLIFKFVTDLLADKSFTIIVSKSIHDLIDQLTPRPGEYVIYEGSKEYSFVLGEYQSPKSRLIKRYSRSQIRLSIIMTVFKYVIIISK
jgi:hypothetical protein